MLRRMDCRTHIYRLTGGETLCTPKNASTESPYSTTIENDQRPKLHAIDHMNHIDHINHIDQIDLNQLKTSDPDVTTSYNVL